MSARNQPDIPNEDELHAFVECELSAFAEQAVLDRLAGQDHALRGLELLRTDREMLRRTDDPAPPEGLIADCLAQVERALLISDDPMAPPIAFPTRRYRLRFNQLAAAAIFVLVVGVGTVVIYRNLSLSADPIRFGDEAAWDEEEAEAAARLLAQEEIGDSGVESPSAEDFDPPNVELNSGSTLAANSGAAVGDLVGGTEGGPLVASEVSDVARNQTAGTEPDTDREPIKRVALNAEALSDMLPLSVADVERLEKPVESALSADVGLAVRLAALDRGSALDRLRALVNDLNTGTALIYNAPPMDTLPSNNGFETVVDPGRWLANLSEDSGPGSGTLPKILKTNRVSRISTPNRRGDNDEGGSVLTIADQLRLVPRADQHAYRDGGYEYTLVGTAAELQGILQAMNDGNDVGRVRVLRRNADGTTTVTSLLDLLPPARPAPSEWTRALCWWENPGRNLELAERLVEAYRVQPIIRIPLKIARR